MAREGDAGLQCLLNKLYTKSEFENTRKNGHQLQQSGSYCNLLQAELVRINNLYVTRSHELSLNLKTGNLRDLHVTNLQVLLVTLILKSCFY